MNKKKVVLAIMALVLVLLVLAGCSTTTVDPKKTGQTLADNGQTMVANGQMM